MLFWLMLEGNSRSKVFFLKHDFMGTISFFILSLGGLTLLVRSHML